VQKTRRRLGSIPADIVVGVSEKDQRRRPSASERDEPVRIEADPEDALRALLKVEPETEHADGPGSEREPQEKDRL
jgi:hypothetical protein